jgi:hypothetical protein
MGAPIAQNVAGHGPYCFRAQGQVYHLAQQGALLNDEGIYTKILFMMKFCNVFL